MIVNNKRKRQARLRRDTEGRKGHEEHIMTIPKVQITFSCAYPKKINTVFRDIRYIQRIQNMQEIMNFRRLRSIGGIGEFSDISCFL